MTPKERQELLRMEREAKPKEPPEPSQWYSWMKGQQPVFVPEGTKMVKCDCGHTVPEFLVMNGNKGTACPNCHKSNG